MDIVKRERAFKIRRLFKSDIDVIMQSFEYLQNLHFNPVNPIFVSQVLMAGEWWGVFDKEKMIACTWLFGADSAFFKSYNALWEVSDLLDDDLKSYMVCGYVSCLEEYRSYAVYRALCKLWNIQGSKHGKKYLVHYACAHNWCDFDALFAENFAMAGLRGLDNLVPHYIFTKKVSFKNIPVRLNDIQEKVPFDDTKQISKLLEHKYRAVATDDSNKFCFVKETDEHE